MFIAMADPRTVLIKLADRLHNMMTLDALPVAKQQRFAKETLEIFAPLANRVGIANWKEQLENLCFKHLNPVQYMELSSKLVELNDDAMIASAINRLDQALTRSTSIRNVLPRHEQGGIFAAEGYARSSGLPGVCIATFGPSVTNLVSGLADARRLFDEIPTKDVVPWNAMIAGYVQSRRFEEAIACFHEMQEANISPNKSTMVSLLSACGHMGSLELGNWIGSWVRDNGFGLNLQLNNALIDMYSRCGEIDTSRELFDGIEEKDVISWNTMIGGYSYLSLYEEALALFNVMLRSNVKPNDGTFLGILHACACLGALDLGKWVHAYIDKNLKSSSNASLWTSLIDMYAKCGCIEAAELVFRRMHCSNLSSWNAMLSGFAMHGHAERALKLFSEMVNKTLFQPDDITFVGVLSACTQAGLVDLGHHYFRLMMQDYGISPKLEHYGCMIDLLARAGKFEDVEILMKNMEMEPDGAIWGSLLSACKAHGHAELGEYVAERLFQLEPKNAGAFVLLSNIYAGAGKWDDVARIRTRLNDKGMKKVPGCTSIEIDGIVHEFLVGDKFGQVVMKKEYESALEVFYEMLDEMVQPNSVTFVSVLSAYSHSGQVDLRGTNVNRYFNCFTQWDPGKVSIMTLLLQP